jgi:ABC-type iron transport system FetAB ATPase subunit
VIAVADEGLPPSLAAGGSAACLRVENLSFLDLGPFQFDVAHGECLGITGPSGSGKTLLLRALADLDPHTGEVYLDGVAAGALPAPHWRRQVGLLPAESAWWADTVGAHFDGVAPPWLDRLGFGPEVLHWEVARLSSGERQRLAFLRLLVGQPAVLLLDEPTANLDAANTGRLEDLVRRYREARGAAVVWVTHDLDQLRRVATRCRRLQNGRLEDS